jgi:hypothetical protein
MTQHCTQTVIGQLADLRELLVDGNQVPFLTSIP